MKNNLSIPAIRKYQTGALLTVCMLLASTCKEANLEGIKKTEFNSPVTLYLSEKAINRESGVMLELTEITDSRCPVNVNCIWAGNAKVKLSVSGTGMEKADLDLCLGQCDTRFQEADTVLFQQNNHTYTLILNKVEPFPGTSNKKKSVIIILKKN